MIPGKEREERVFEELERLGASEKSRFPTISQSLVPNIGPHPFAYLSTTAICCDRHSVSHGPDERHHAKMRRFYAVGLIRVSGNLPYRKVCGNFPPSLPLRPGAR